MANQTIEKVFNILFTYPIWRVEVDTENRLIAVETRNPADTLPHFHVITHDGDYVLRDFQAIAKEWVLAGIQCGKMILKKISSTSPIDAGVQVVDCYDSSEQQTWFNYILVELIEGGLLVRPKMIEQGVQLFLDLKTLSLADKKEQLVKPFDNQVVYPIIYHGQLPHFLTDYTPDGDVWINALNDYFIWAFYEKNKDNRYQIRIAKSTRETLVDAVIAVGPLAAKFFNIHFLVNKQIFLLTDNKREFVSYLV